MRHIDPDEVSRVTLLGLMDGSAATLEEAEEKASDRRLNIFAVTSTPDDASWQAAVMTAVLVAARAFGQVTLVTNVPDAAIHRGPFSGGSLRDFADAEGTAVLLPDDAYIPSTINVSIGDQGVATP